MTYGSLLTELGYSGNILKAHAGDFSVPSFTIDAPFKGAYGFPPIIVPLWSNGAWPGYIGISTKWFGMKEEGFLSYYSESQIISEIAKSFEQLAAWLTFDFLCNIPNESEVGRFAESIGLCRPGEVERYFDGCSDINDLSRLAVFKSDLPQAVVGGRGNVQPAWVQKGVNKNRVMSLLDNGDFVGAWYAINSPGLSRGEIRNFLDIIAPFAEDERFFHLVECWCRANP